MIENFEDLELAIKNAISSKTKKLNLIFSRNFEFIFPEFPSELCNLQELVISPHSQGYIRTNLPSSIGNLTELKKIIRLCFCKRKSDFP